jgi:hypothetical protein
MYYILYRVEERVPAKYHPYTKFLCAAGAYIACSVALVPGEVLKTGLQAGVVSLNYIFFIYICIYNLLNYE